MENTALIIIDMQDCMRTYRPLARNNPHAEQQIAALLHAWRGAASVFAQLPQHVIEKNVPDAFIQSSDQRFWV